MAKGAKRKPPASLAARFPPRAGSRAGGGGRARVRLQVWRGAGPDATMLLVTLRGTPTIYMGEALGMAGTSIPPDMPLDQRAADPYSMMSLYRQLFMLRRAQPASRAGSVGGVAAQGSVLYYGRHAGERLAVMLNMGGPDRPGGRYPPGRPGPQKAS